MQPRRLFRSKQDRRIAGVCGGLAEYFSIDPLLVRIGMVVAGFMGWGILLYIIMWLVVPEQDGAASGGTGASAVRIAEERFARGEITAEELERIRGDLQGT